MAQPVLALRVPLVVCCFAERHGQFVSQVLCGGPLADRAPGDSRDLLDPPRIRVTTRPELGEIADVFAVKRVERPTMASGSKPVPAAMSLTYAAGSPLSSSLTTASRTGRSRLNHVGSIFPFRSRRLRERAQASASRWCPLVSQQPGRLTAGQAGWHFAWCRWTASR